MSWNFAVVSRNMNIRFACWIIKRSSKSLWPLSFDPGRNRCSVWARKPAPWSHHTWLGSKAARGLLLSDKGHRTHVPGLESEIRKHWVILQTTTYLALNWEKLTYDKRYFQARRPEVTDHTPVPLLQQPNLSVPQITPPHFEIMLPMCMLECLRQEHTQILYGTLSNDGSQFPKVPPQRFREASRH